MNNTKALNYITKVVENTPSDWLKLTTHRLDIYDESRAKTEFLERFEECYKSAVADKETLSKLPTAYDYIRLGHPLSSVLEWAIAQELNIKTDRVISFSSRTTPVLAVLRKNLLEKRKTQILYTGQLPAIFDAVTLKKVYN